MRDQKGFTLVELLVVVAIIGILAAIAIPQFSQYRVKAYNSTAKSDLRNLVSAEEAYYADHQVYVSDHGGGSIGVTASKNVTLTATADAGGGTWAGTARHGKGDVTYAYSSATGKITP